MLRTATSVAYIGMMAFRRGSAELMLPHQIGQYAYRRLGCRPGKTPLAHVSSGQVHDLIFQGIRAALLHRAGNDGRPTSLSSRGSAPTEVQGIAESITVPGVAWVVVDAGTGRPRFDNAIRLAEKLNADYFTLRDLNQDSLANGIRSVMDRDC